MSGELRKPHTLMRLRHWLGQLLANVKHYHERHPTPVEQFADRWLRFAF
jgi:hypothetical protein